MIENNIYHFSEISNWNSLTIKEKINKIIDLIGRDSLQDIISNSNGRKDVCRKLSLPEKRHQRVFEYFSELGLNTSTQPYKAGSLLDNYSKEELQKILNLSSNWVEFCKAIGYSQYDSKTVKYVKELGLDYSNILNSPLSSATTKEKAEEITFDLEKVKIVVKSCNTWEEIYSTLCTSRYSKDKLRLFIKENNIDVDHLYYGSRRKNLLNFKTFNEQEKEDLYKEYEKEQLNSTSKMSPMFTEDQLRESVAKNFNWQDVSHELGYKNSNPSYLKKKCKEYNIDYSHFKSSNLTTSYSKEFLEPIIVNSKGWSDVAHALGRARVSNAFKRYVKKLGIDISHFKVASKEEVPDDLFSKVVQESNSVLEVRYKITSLNPNFKFLYYKDIMTKIKELNLDTSHFGKIYIEHTDEELKEIIRKATSWIEVYKEFGFPTDYKCSKIKERVKELGFNFDHFSQERAKAFSLENISEEELRKVVINSNTYAEVTRNLFKMYNFNFNEDKVRRFIQKVGIDCSHFMARKTNIESYSKEELEKFVEESDSWVDFFKHFENLNYVSSKVKNYVINLGIDVSKFRKFERWTTEKFKEYLKTMYGDAITCIGEVINTSTPVKMYCKEHGEFERTPDDIFRGHLCPKCTMSEGEFSITHFLEANHITYESHKTFEDLKLKLPLSYDFYLKFKGKEICIEYQGQQHLRPATFGSQNYEQALDKFKYQLYRDKLKKEYCDNNDIELIEIFKVREIPKKLGFLIEGKNSTNN